VSDGGGALDNVKEAFQGKRGKILLIGGGAAIAVYVWYTRRNGTPDPAAAADPTAVVADGPSGRTPQTDPEVGNTSTGSVGPRKYTNNADWLSDGTSFLQGRGTPAGNAYDALTKALAGLTLTAQEIAWVSQVIGALGAPPEGMPPLNASAPPGNPQGTPTTRDPVVTPGQKPAPGSKRGYGWYRVQRGATASALAKTYGISLPTFYLYNGPGRLVAGQWVKVRAASNPVLGPYNGK
jgi:hypothetical protein